MLTPYTEEIGQAVILGLAIAWVIAFVLVPAELLRSLAELPRRELVAAAALLLVALALRWGLALWGPGDYIPRQLSAYDQHPNFYHGSTPVALWALVFSLVAPDDGIVAGVGIALATLAPLLLALALRELGLGSVGAWGAGFALAIHPFAVRFAADQSRVAQAVFLIAVALWALARHWNRPRGRLLLLFVAATWLACRARPEAGVVLVVEGLALLVVRLGGFAGMKARLRERPLRLEVAALLVAGFLGVGNLLLSTGAEPTILSSHLGQARTWLGWKPLVDALWADPDYTAVAMMVVAGLGAVVGLVRRPRLAIWALASLIIAAYLSSNGTLSLNMHLANARYQALPLLVFCVCVGLGFAALADLRRFGEKAAIAGVALGGLAIVATSPKPMERITQPRTIDLEYRFARRAMATLPPCAKVLSPVPAPSKMVGSVLYLGVLAWLLDGREWHDWPWPPEALADTEGCPTYFYRSTQCSIDPESIRAWYPDSLASIARCGAVLARIRAAPVLEERIPARPFGVERYTGDELTIGFYPVDTALLRGPDPGQRGGKGGE